MIINPSDYFRDEKSFFGMKEIFWAALQKKLSADYG
jgi:hypothetical protein